MLDSAYTGQLSLPSFVSCAITCYANARFVSIDPNALLEKIQFTFSEVKQNHQDFNLY